MKYSLGHDHTIVVLVISLLFMFSARRADAQTVNCSAGNSLQAAIDSAPIFSTITVTGTCNQSIFIGATKSNLTIDGGTSATISVSAVSPGITILGRSITVMRLNVTGGSNGIIVSDGGDAVLDRLTIQNAARDGVHGVRNAFVHVVNTTIQNNAGNGILLTEGSGGRIGFFNIGDSVTSPNTIQNNGLDGIQISNTSNARILGNTIRGNVAAGVNINSVSHGHVAGNVIGSNGGDGVQVSENSGVNLGFDSGSTIHDPPNSTGTPNTGFGIRCIINSSANGRLGTLAGIAGAKSITTGCIDSLL